MTMMSTGNFVVLCLAVLTARVLSDGDCGSPEPIGNGYVLSRGPYYNGSFATYTCQNGYSMTGSAQVECVAKVWTGDLPTCTITNNNGDTVTTNNNDVAQWALIALAAILLLALIVATILGIYFCCCRDKGGGRTPVERYDDEDYYTREGKTMPPKHKRDWIRYEADSSQAHKPVWISYDSKPEQRTGWVRFENDSPEASKKKTTKSNTKPITPRTKPAPLTTKTMPVTTITSSKSVQTAAVPKPTPKKTYTYKKDVQDKKKEENYNTSSPNTDDKSDAKLADIKIENKDEDDNARNSPVSSNNDNTAQPTAEANNNRGASNVDKSPRLKKIVNDLNKTKTPVQPARIWMPHSKPIRNINTSTK